MILRPARAEEVPAALALLQGWTDEEQPRAFQIAARKDWANTRLMVAIEKEQVQGALLAESLPGNSTLIWPPRTRPFDPALQTRLLQIFLNEPGTARSLHCLLDEDDPSAQSLRSVGFLLITRVLQMTRAADRPLPLPGKRQVELVEFSERSREEFDSILMESQRESLDCPELFEESSTAEVLEGYRESVPDRSGWYLARNNRDHLGIAILAGDQLHYMGLVASARGRGYGHALMRSLLERRPVNSLAVDERNLPARHVYDRAGFEVMAEKQVWLFRGSSSAGSESVNLG